MHAFVKRLAVTAALAVPAAAAAQAPQPAGPPASPANSFRMAPSFNQSQPAPVSQVVPVGGPGQAKFSSNTAAIPGFIGPGIYAPYVNPFGGYLSGGADVIQAQGQFAINYQQARLVQQQVEQSKMDLKRRQYDEWLYERNTRPTLEEERERTRMQELQRARGNPPATEIWSGKALNDLLDQLVKVPVRGPTVPLDPNLLRHINLTAGTSVGSLGVFRDQGRLTWPMALRGSAFDADRKKLDELAAAAFKQVQAGSLDPGTVNDMNTVLARMQNEVRAVIDTVTPTQNIQARRFLNEISDSVQALQDPNAGKFATGKWSATGADVSELIQNMRSNGLRFAPATIGDQPFYTALHRAMVDYDTGLSMLAGRQTAGRQGS